MCGVGWGGGGGSCGGGGGGGRRKVGGGEGGVVEIAHCDFSAHAQVCVKFNKL